MVQILNIFIISRERSYKNLLSVKKTKQTFSTFAFRSCSRWTTTASGSFNFLLHAMLKTKFQQVEVIMRTGGGRLYDRGPWRWGGLRWREVTLRGSHVSSSPPSTTIGFTHYKIKNKNIYLFKFNTINYYLIWRSV